MTNGKRCTQSAARIAALSVLSLVVMAVVLTTTASATVTTNQQGWQDLTAGVTYRYMLPFELGVISTSGDDSQAPAVGGYSRYYAHPHRYIMPSTGYQSFNSYNNWISGSGYSSYYSLITLNSIGYTLIEFDRYMRADIYDTATSYLPRVSFSQFASVGEGAQADAYCVEAVLTINYYYQTGYSLTDVSRTTYESTGTGRTDIDLSMLVFDAFGSLVADDPMAGTQGDIASFAFAIEFYPYEVRDNTRIDGHTYTKYLQVTDNYVPEINSESEYLSLFYRYDDDVGAVVPMPPAENWMSWITTAVGGFMDAPLIGESFTLGNFLGAICVVLVVVVLLKIFAGG